MEERSGFQSRISILDERLCLLTWPGPNYLHTALDNKGQMPEGCGGLVVRLSMYDKHVLQVCNVRNSHIYSGDQILE